MSRQEFVGTIANQLEEIQTTLFERAKAYREENTRQIETKDEFYDYFTPKNKEKPEIHGGFASCHWNGSSEVEAKVQEELGVTVRCIPLEKDNEPGQCVITGEDSPRRVIFAKAY